MEIIDKMTDTPFYMNLSKGEWNAMISFLESNVDPCHLCPRQCRARRLHDEKGVCGALKDVKIASCNLHYGEEPPISGEGGSGTVFFSGCTMRCKFCQNYPISQLLKLGKNQGFRIIHHNRKGVICHPFGKSSASYG